ncbi:CS1 type fimbrial major subunit [Stenotrophomonas chelatiphaga]|uniref:CS1 type fimbrial major subunit n=1 Tax=Stenotrophomonas chelatiphaga TaxID=517011 RepID=UPI00289A1056|nr:CS1 type fimbrial major subunit [Stenotrophomonas chelatiphaga]
MKTHCRNALLALALAAASTSAHAVQADIKIWADVDPTLSLLRADGSALPDAVALTYQPLSGLSPWTEQVRIFSNDTSKDVSVRLGNAAELRPVVAATGAAPIPMTVRLNGRPLAVSNADFDASTLFDGALPGASIAMPLVIEQTTRGPITAAGLYEGLVSVVLVQKAGSP